jgi:hypothetical protein
MLAEYKTLTGTIHQNNCYWLVFGDFLPPLNKGEVVRTKVLAKNLWTEGLEIRNMFTAKKEKNYFLKRPFFSGKSLHS